jgi:translation elongation factor EF-1beta
LKGRDWLVGDSFTAADLILAFMIILPLTYQFGLEFRQKQAPHLAAWFDKVSRLPAFISVAGYVKLCTVPIAPVGATQQEPLTQEQIDELMDFEAEDAEEQEEPKKEAKKDDDDLDLFGSDDEDDAAAAEALKKKAAEAKAKKDKPKKVVIAKSLVLFEVKPYEAETKMADMAAEILKIEMDGLWWKTEWKTEPIAYGVEKLIIGCTVEDEKVSVDDLQEKIEGLEDLVQSVEIIGFNKI